MSEVFDLHWDRGWEFYKAEKFEDAIAEWRLAGELDPKDGYVNNNIGQALSKLGQKDAAFSEWQKAIYLEPKYDIPCIHLADALLEAGDVSQALTAIRTAIRLCPPSANLYIRLGCYLTIRANENSDKAGWEAAATAFQQAIDTEPTNFYALSMLGELKWYLGKKREAIAALQAAVAGDPTNIEAYLQLWKYQSYARHFRDMARTNDAMHKLPDPEGRIDQYVADLLNPLWKSIRRNLLIGTGMAAVLVGAVIWNRRRGR